MDRTTKILSLISLLIIFGGVFLLWQGLKTVSDSFNPASTPTPTQLSQTESVQSESTGSALGEAISEIDDSSLVLVTKVVDGDTIEIAGGQTVRFIGIDTPETVDPRRPVGCFGKEASSEVKR